MLIKDTNLKITIALFILLVSVSVTRAASEQTKNVNLKSAKLEAFYLTGDGDTYSGMASWTPTFFKIKEINIGISTGIAPIKLAADPITTVYEAVIRADYKFTEKFGVELSSGYQYWASTNLDEGYLVGGAIHYYLNNESVLGIKKPTFVDHVIFGYSYIDQSEAYHMIRIGLGFSF